MRKWTTAILISGGLGVAGGCIIPKSDCEWDNTCNGSSSGGTDSGSDVKPDITPPGCDPTKDPKDNVECVVNSFGVFIDGAGGNDQNDGSKEKPVKTFKTALSKLGNKSRLYVCAGSYGERVELTSAISIYGGFACGTWTYAASNKVTIAPQEAGVALTLKNGGADPVAFQDIEVKAAPGAAAGDSSIAASVADSASVSFARARLEAGEAVDGQTVPVAPFAWDASNLPVNGQIPLGATPNTGGIGGKLTCPGGAVTEGGVGGNNKIGQYDGQLGSPGGGPGGPGGTACTGGTDAVQPGVAPEASPASSLGKAEAGAWLAAAPAAGRTGAPGGGGGGGGAKDGEGGGGGGGSGGCGGAGGGGGLAGGSSIALVSFNAGLRVADSVLLAKAGRAGGSGAVGQDGDTRFGQFTLVLTQSCNGGRGARGGKGGAGAGGAGGLSVGVLYKGTAPKLEGTTDANITIGAPGSKGPGGGAGNDGPKGRAAKVLATEPDGTVKPE